MYIDDVFQFGQLIKRTRKEIGLSQKQLALVAGIGVRLIVELENGTRGMNLNTVIKICKLLGIKINLTK